MQYVSIKYTEQLAEAGVEPSAGSLGDSYDNAFSETINGLYKAEVIHRRGPWGSFEAVAFTCLEWVGWSNTRQLFDSIGNRLRRNEDGATLPKSAARREPALKSPLETGAVHIG